MPRRPALLGSLALSRAPARAGSAQARSARRAAVAVGWLAAACGEATPGADPAPYADAGAPDAASADSGTHAAADDAGTAAYDGPSRLRETGLFAAPEGEALAPDVLAFDVVFPLWSDGADKARFLALPPGGAIDTRDPDGWVFPVGTRAWKSFTRDGVRVETRYLEKRADGWRAVAFVWRDDGADADAAPDGAPDARGTPHDVPAVDACHDCHRGAADHLLGVGALQQSGPGGLLERLAAEGRLSEPPPPGGYGPPGEPTAAAALGYLHANCGSCHSPWHPLASRRVLRLHLPVGVASSDAAPAVVTAAGVPAFHHIDDAHVLLAPGDPEASQLYVRAGQRGPLGMPSRGTEDVDAAGLARLRAWIETLPR